MEVHEEPKISTAFDLTKTRQYRVAGRRLYVSVFRNEHFEYSSEPTYGLINTSRAVCLYGFFVTSLTKKALAFH